MTGTLRRDRLLLPVPSRKHLDFDWTVARVISIVYPDLA